MKRAILTHRLDFAAIATLIALAIATVAYVLLHQPAFTFGRSYYTVYAEFQSASAVSAGQGQAVTIAGVQVGTVGGVRLRNGVAVVTMDIDKRYAPIYRDATVLLQERTPLKDMYLSLDPGSRSAGAVPAGGTLGTGNTQPVVDVDQVLSSLDADTRTYLLLLLSGGAQGLSAKSAPADLRAIFRRFPPLASGTERFASLLAQRSGDLRAAIHELGLVTGALSGVDAQLAGLVKSSSTVFTAISSEDAALGRSLTALPPTLRETGTTLAKVRGLAAATGPALTELEPFATGLAPALAAVRPLASDTTGVIANDLRPFVAAVKPLARELEPAAASLKSATPTVASSLHVVNRLLNGLAYQGRSGHSYLYWGSWFAHNLDSVSDVQDANGAIVRGLFLASCPALGLLQNILQKSIPSLGPLLDLLGEPLAADLKSPYCETLP